MDDFDRIEEHRDRVAGFEYEHGRPLILDRHGNCAICGEPLDPAYDAREAYELDDPKHPDHYETLVDIADME